VIPHLRPVILSCYYLTAYYLPRRPHLHHQKEDSEDRDDSEDRAEGLLVLVDQVEGNTARGMVTQGDTDEISESELLAFSTDRDNKAKDPIGTAIVIQ